MKALLSLVLLSVGAVGCGGDTEQLPSASIATPTPPANQSPPASIATQALQVDPETIPTYDPPQIVCSFWEEIMLSPCGRYALAVAFNKLSELERLQGRVAISVDLRDGRYLVQIDPAHFRSGIFFTGNQNGACGDCVILNEEFEVTQILTRSNGQLYEMIYGQALQNPTFQGRYQGPGTWKPLWPNE